MHTVNLLNPISELHDQHNQQHGERHLETPSSMAEQEDVEMVNLNGIEDLEQVISEDIVTIPKEMILITLVSQEHALFNPKHKDYRNTQHKDAKWLKIAQHVGWQETQCKAKWKALRDQYCRELKRSKLNAKTNVKWKYYKVLDFLRPYALARHYRSRSFTNTDPTPTITSAVSLGLSTSTTAAVTESSPTDGTVHGMQIKSETVMLPNLLAEQLHSAIQQQNWNYLTTTSTIAPTTIATARSDQTEGSNSIAADDALYNALVSCVNVAATGNLQQQHQQIQNHAQNNEEEDEDPIHFYLNMEGCFEKELISLIQQEELLYDANHKNYRNCKMKLEIWNQIARKTEKSVKQCRQKWKALRDQFIREHKRLMSRVNLESLPRWKHYDALSFLQKFIKYKMNGTDAQQMILLPKIETNPDLDEQVNNTSSLDSPHVQQQLGGLSALPTLTGPHLPQATQNQNLGPTNNHHQLPALVHHHDNNNESEGLCVSANYDEMDIDNLINGDGGTNEIHNNNDSGDGDDDIQECECDNTNEQHLESTDFNTKSSTPKEDREMISLKMVAVSNQNTMTTSSIINQALQMACNNKNHPEDPTMSMDKSNTIQLQQHQQQLPQHLNSQQHEETQYPPTPTSSSSAHLLMSISSSNTSSSSTNMNNVEQQYHNTNHSSTHQQVSEDDETGAFFKAITMKIRNANLPPVAFTDLQINILRVINESLRNN